MPLICERYYLSKVDACNTDILYILCSDRATLVCLDKRYIFDEILNFQKSGMESHDPLMKGVTACLVPLCRPVDTIDEESLALRPRRGWRCWWLPIGIVLCSTGIVINEMHAPSILKRPMNQAYGISLNAESSCGQSALWAYTIHDAPESDVTLAEPGCPVTVSLDGDAVSRWDLTRIWSRPWKSALSRATARKIGEGTALVVLWEPGLYRIQATTSQSGLVLTKVLRCMYVRREVRQLSVPERAAYVDAVQVIAQTDPADGQRMYGPNFRSLAQLTTPHIKGAGARTGDEMHDGLGFLPQHTALSIEFEKALQVVDPTIALPYWDFTRDASFGSVEANPELWDDTVGFFGWLPQISRYNANSSSYLRAPWNLSPTPQISRPRAFCGRSHAQTEWPSCAVHRSLLSTASLDAFLRGIQGKAHGIVHMMIGGLAGCGSELMRLPSSILLGVKDYVQLAWRMGLIEFHESRYTCHTTDLDAWNTHFFNNVTARAIMPNINKDMRSQGYRAALVAALCANSSRWIWGEHAGADSPWDPSFWPIHPTLDRLYQYKLLVDPGMRPAWPSNSSRTCKWQALGFGCHGHHAEDLTVYRTTVLDGGAYFRNTPITNLEMLVAADPRDYRLDYIYDNFNWPHCDQSAAFDMPLRPAPWTRRKSEQIVISSSLCDADGFYVAPGACSTRDLPVARGVDVVSYRNLSWAIEPDHRGIPLRGSPQYAVTLEGSFTFWFASPETRDRFAENPTEFAPAFGGFCALGLSGSDPRRSGAVLKPETLETIPADPDIWWLDNQTNKLFLFKGQAALDIFLSDLHDPQLDLRAAAERAWQSDIIGTLPCIAPVLFNTRCFDAPAYPVAPKPRVELKNSSRHQALSHRQ